MKTQNWKKNLFYAFVPLLSFGAAGSSLAGIPLNEQEHSLLVVQHLESDGKEATLEVLNDETQEFEHYILDSKSKASFSLFNTDTNEKIPFPFTAGRNQGFLQITPDVKGKIQLEMIYETEGKAPHWVSVGTKANMLISKNGNALSDNTQLFLEGPSGDDPVLKLLTDFDMDKTLVVQQKSAVLSCNADSDQDFVEDCIDNCPKAPNNTQKDTDKDGVGDACEFIIIIDTDKDGVADGKDNCPFKANADQADADNDGIGDACEDPQVEDNDGDGVINGKDNCPAVANADQADADNDGIGDACEDPQVEDNDGDGVINGKDNCPAVANTDQIDTDADGIGDACDNNDGINPEADDDADGVINGKDNCPTVANADQVDTDNDGVGDTCEDEEPANENGGCSLQAAGTTNGSAFAWMLGLLGAAAQLALRTRKTE